ncbi:NlmOI [Streptomyces sp. NBC_00878]|uniref:NlmOI n=1 Tax=Streptomyces sp. NBC_00878 TaxID=2975854 RepID=UPI00224E5269|nr:NlmOI [Streptomyces sp. NBC_00878]MCX4902873.1 NlmOI [Streptomyces sp. NBC_00878]
MKQLDFLLGEFRLEYTNLTTEQVTTGRATSSGKALADGRFHEITQYIPVPGITAVWLIGWSDIEGHFVSFYYDDWGHHGTFTSPGWEDGHFRITGDSSVFGGRHRFVDDYEIDEDGSVLKKGYVYIGEDLVPGDIVRFRR